MMLLATRTKTLPFCLASAQLRKCLPQLSPISKFSSDSTRSENDKKKESMFTRWLGPNAGVASAENKVNRWTMFIPAFLTHACLGASYGWSAVSSSLTREHGEMGQS